MSRASDLERQMLDLINEERTSRGLDPVALELRLNDSSEDHSQWMLEEDRFSHTGENGSSAGDRMRDANFDFEGNWSWGENIAYQSERGAPGLADDVEDLHDSLMNSPGHRANILNPDYEVVGLGIEVGDFNGFEAVMVTQNFASTDAELQIDDAAAQSPAPVDEAPDPQPDPDAEDPEEPVAEAPGPENEDPEEPVAEGPEPEPEETEDPVAEAPEPEPEDPVAEMPEPEPEDPEDPVAEAPEPELETPDMPEPEDPVAEDPDPEPEDPVAEAPEPEMPTDTPEPDTPDVADDGPLGDIDNDTFAQLQFFVTGFFAALFDEEFTFTWDGGDNGEPQTVTFDVDELFDSLFNGANDGDDMGGDDMMLAQDDTAGADDTGFRFVEEWDCLA